MKFDHKILGLLADDARIKLKEISKITLKSLQRVKYTFSLYEREKYIEFPHAIIDYARLGLLLFRVYFSGAYFGEQDKERIVKACLEIPEIVSVYELEGAYDLVIEIVAPNPSNFNKLFRQLLLRFPTLTSYLIVLNTVTYIFPREYLFKLDKRTLLIGGDRAIEPVGEDELHVLRGLSINPRIPKRTLAKKLGMHAKTLDGIVHRMKDRKILRGFQFVLNTSALNMSKFRVFLTFHNLTAEREEACMKYIESIPEVIFLNKTLSFWECDIESFDKRKIRKFLLTIREEFKDILQNCTSAEFYQFYKKQYIPLK